MSRPIPVTFGPAVRAHKRAIVALLREAGLPTRDLRVAHLANFVVARKGSRVVGSAGLEVFGAEALLRSVAVSTTHRGGGVGRTLVAQAEALASQLGLKQLHLLTTTAEDFFARLGYSRVPRPTAPTAIRTSIEFSLLCPSSSVLMRRTLGNATRQVSG